MKILAVDDQESILELLKVALAVSGVHEVVTAISGKEALAILQAEETQFDCLLVDIQMPVMDGIGLCNHIRALPGYYQTPIVMVTAMSEKHYIEKAFSAGATDYITKPFDFFEIGTRLNMVSKLVQENRVASDSFEQVARLKVELNGKMRLSLHDPVEIQGIERAVGFVAFENYVLQLTRGALFMSSVFAIKIADVEAIYGDSTASAFRSILTAAALDIAESTKLHGSLFSYRGNGVFLCIDHNRVKNAHREMIKKLRQSKARFGPDNADSGRKKNIQYIVGEQISLGLLSRSSALISLRNATEKVETKTVNRNEILTGSDNVSALAVERKKQMEKRKSEYKELFRDSLDEHIQTATVRTATSLN